MPKPTPDETFEQQAAAYAHGSVAILRGFLDALEHAQTGCDGEECAAGADSDWPEAWHDEDAARRQIDEDPLEIEVRGDWHVPGDPDTTPTEYFILLCTGGPAARITGKLDEHGEPESAVFEYQDWFKPWTEVYLSPEERDTILKYAQLFYFGS